MLAVVTPQPPAVSLQTRLGVGGIDHVPCACGGPASPVATAELRDGTQPLTVQEVNTNVKEATDIKTP